MVRESSIAAYNVIKENGYLSASHFQVYDIIVKNNGDLTRGEVYKILKENGLKDYATHVSARLAELRDMGVIEEGEKRKCSETSMLVLTWYPKDALPKRVKRKTYKQRLTEAEQFIKDNGLQNKYEEVLNGNGNTSN